ncbi:MAG: CapA family protein [Patescibacteria group bacterium]
MLQPIVEAEKKNAGARLSYAHFSSHVDQTYDSLTFVGDILLARNVEYLMQKQGTEYPFAGLNLSLIGNNSAVIGNFEAAIPQTHIRTPTEQITFSVATSAVPVLKKGGITHVSLANNHAHDFEAEGLKHTKKVLEMNTISTFGEPDSVSSESVNYVHIKDQTVALIALQGIGMETAPVSWRSLIRRATKQSDIQIVFIHWGDEYALRHSPAQEQLATELVTTGVDLIIGHHPHVVEDIGVIEGVPVFYSIGNYIFDQYFSKDVQEGLVLHVYEDSGWYVHLLPVSSQGSLSQPHKMSDLAHQKFLRSLARKSQGEIRADIERGRIALLNLAVATSSKMAMIRR